MCNDIYKIIIKPFESADDYLLGGYRKNIIRSFGTAYVTIINNIQKNLIEKRYDTELVYLKYGRNYILDSVRCLEDSNPFIGDVNIFEIGLDKLKEIDNDFISNGGWVIFRNLGIAVGGLGKKKIPEKRQVIVFRRESLKNFESFGKDS
jgi:hypothetical protein